MLASDIFDSRHSAITQTSHPQQFVTICELIRQLEEQRIVEQLARPTPLPFKHELMHQTNLTLSAIQTYLHQIHDISADFRGRETLTLADTLVTASAWKNGIRKVQGRISDFYEHRMKHFHTVNSHMRLGLELVELQEREWAKGCVSRMSPFCLCG